MRKDGGAAFPDEINEGMSLRDYFAAHAPDDIPFWFTGPDLPEPPKPVPPPEIADYVRKWWFDNEPSDLVGFLPDDAPIEHHEMADAFQNENVAHCDAIENRRNQLVIRKYFAWRWYYADMMIEEASRQIKEEG